MKPDSARIRLVQMEIQPGHPQTNLARMLAQIAEARRDKVELLIFPEMAVPGYLIGDTWEYEAFLRECESCNEEIRNAAEDLIVVFGSVGVDWNRHNEDGRVRKYNALYVAENRRFRGPVNGPYPYVIKTLLPNYREFDDSRHFFDLRKLALEQDRPLAHFVTPVKTESLSLGCAICEDAWNGDYHFSPFGALAQHPADFFINISSSPFTFHKKNKRDRVYTALAGQLPRPLLYVNNVGIQNNGKTVFTFDGASGIYDHEGIRARCPVPFEETCLTCDLPVAGHIPLDLPAPPAEDDTDTLRRAIEYGTSGFMKLCGASRVVIGVSGGIDSALVAAIYRRILPPDNILLVNMPGAFTSPTTRRLAETLADQLECFYTEIPIPDSVEVSRRQLDGLTITSRNGFLRKTLPWNQRVLENVQARDRSARILAALAASFGGVFTCNANKSEATVGYTTLYGDLSGYLANIADLWKTEVYELARHYNRQVFGREVIPQGCFDIKPSAELSPDQNVDEGKGDPLIYPYHDKLFSTWIERWNRATPEDILEWYHEGTLAEEIRYSGSIRELFPDSHSFIADLERWWNAFLNMGVAKRIQAPPVLAVKKRAFGFDYRESQLGPHYTRRYQELKKEILQIQ